MPGMSRPSFSRSRNSVPEIFSTRAPFWHFVVRNVAVLVFEVNHHAEGHHGDADFGSRAS